MCSALVFLSLTQLVLGWPQWTGKLLSIPAVGLLVMERLRRKEKRVNDHPEPAVGRGRGFTAQAVWAAQAW